MCRGGIWGFHGLPVITTESTPHCVLRQEAMPVSQHVQYQDPGRLSWNADIIAISHTSVSQNKMSAVRRR